MASPTHRDTRLSKIIYFEHSYETMAHLHSLKQTFRPSSAQTRSLLTHCCLMSLFAFLHIPQHLGVDITLRELNRQSCKLRAQLGCLCVEPRPGTVMLGNREAFAEEGYRFRVRCKGARNRERELKVGEICKIVNLFTMILARVS